MLLCCCADPSALFLPLLLLLLLLQVIWIAVYSFMVEYAGVVPITALSQ
jgi:hypothetical protein